MSSSPSDATRSTPRVLICQWCGRQHHEVALAPGERALCARCGTLLARRARFGDDSTLAFTITGLALAVPALMLPFATVDKLRSEQVVFLLSGPEALWNHGMRLLAVWVMLCGAIAPIVLLGTLAGLLVARKFHRAVPGHRFLRQVGYALEHWAMPEV